MAGVVVGLSGCAGPLQSRPGEFAARTAPVRIAGRNLSVTYVTPAAPHTRDFLILFASGDAGYFGVSGDVIEHLAEQGYFLVTYDARQLVAREKKSRTRARIAELAALYDTMLVDARRSLGIPDRVPVIVTGYSRGATLVVLSAALEALRHHLAGAVAIALTRHADYLERPRRDDPLSSVMVDEKGRFQTYPAIPSAGSLPFALIQGTEDSYIQAPEARRLFGPDTPRRRFYEVHGDHTFGGARDTLMRDLDDALEWIRGIAGAN
jgi:virulence protein VirJ